MRDSHFQGRITRVVVGDDNDMQLAQLQAVMQRIQTALHGIPATERIYLGNALLNLAVSRIVGEGDWQRTVGPLMRLRDAVRTYPAPRESSQTIDPGTPHG